VNPAEAIFLYLPVPYWAAFVVLLYRHDLSRLFHPFRDDGRVRSWWFVLNHLGLLSKERPERRPGRKSEFLPYVMYVAVSLVASLSWVLKFYSSLWYHLLIAQGTSAIVLTAMTMQYLGSPPRRAYVDVLRFPRLGSRVRHLAKVLRDVGGGPK
jgi:hypothetical protein